MVPVVYIVIESWCHLVFGAYCVSNVQSTLSLKTVCHTVFVFAASTAYGTTHSPSIPATVTKNRVK